MSGSIDLSIALPSYNEELRLPATLLEIKQYFASLPHLQYEVIVIDDGSTDRTRSVVEKLGETWPQLRLISYQINRGKGCAVRCGVLAAIGEFILFADADGSTPIAEELKLRNALRGGADVAVGSRLIAAEGVRCNRSMVRRLSSRLFAFYAGCVLPVGVKDTQCGFKMFRREVAHRLFEACYEDRFLFDLFILRIARRWNYVVVESPVNWTEVPGSKIRLFADSVEMFCGLWNVRQRVAKILKE